MLAASGVAADIVSDLGQACAIVPAWMSSGCAEMTVGNGESILWTAGQQLGASHPHLDRFSLQSDIGNLEACCRRTALLAELSSLTIRFPVLGGMPVNSAYICYISAGITAPHGLFL